MIKNNKIIIIIIIIIIVMRIKNVMCMLFFNDNIK